MKIGVSGHQARDGIDWTWVRQQVERALVGKSRLIGFSSLAVGSDQLFAESILNKNGKLYAVLPLEDYRSFFSEQDALSYDRLLEKSEIVRLDSKKTPERAFLDAGRWIVREIDQLIAIWDGEPVDGAGGTGDIVAYAASLGKPTLHIEPIGKTVSAL